MDALLTAASAPTRPNDYPLLFIGYSTLSEVNV